MDSVRGGAPLLVKFVLLFTAPLETCIGAGYGGGRAAGAGDGVGGVGPGRPLGVGTGLALPPRPSGPLPNAGRPVGGKSDFRGAAGLGWPVIVPAPEAAVVTTSLLLLPVVIAVVDAGNTPPELLPSDAWKRDERGILEKWFED